MSHGNKLIAKNSLILLLRLFVTSIFGLISTRIVIQSLGTSDYGLYALIGGIVVMLVFLNNVMMTSTYRFIAYELGANNVDRVNKIFNISLLIHLSIGVLIFILAESIGVYYVKSHLNVEPEKIKDAVFILRLSAYATIANVVSVPYQGLLVAKENFSATAKIEVFRSILGLIVALIILNYTGNRLRLYAILISFINFIPTCVFIAYCKKHYQDLVRWQLQKDKLKYKEMLGFSGWIMLGAAAGIAKNSGSALVVNSFFGTVLNASFGIANQVNNMVQMFSSSIGQAAIPQITKSYSGGDSDRTVTLTIYLSKYVFFIMLIPALPILLETEFILVLWLGELPPYAALLVQLIIINAMMDSLGGVGAIAQATGKIKYFQVIISTLSVLSLPIAYYLFKLNFLPPTIVAVFIATSVINLILSVILLKYIIKFDVKNYLHVVHKRILYVLLTLVWLFFAKEYFEEGWMRFVVVVFCSVMILIFSIYMVGLDQREKVVVASIYREFVVKKLKGVKK
ncbi:MAG: MATE family efflux transporter [Bacteroidia bacterium]|nr:MATE family efflux transporter [Bacteroidia bacterium]